MTLSISEMALQIIEMKREIDIYKSILNIDHVASTIVFSEFQPMSSLTEKLDIAIRHVDDTQDKLTKAKMQYQQKCDHLTADILLSDESIVDLDRRKRVTLAETSLSDKSKLTTERVQKFVEKSSRHLDTLLSKIRLRNTSLKTVHYRLSTTKAWSLTDSTQTLQKIDHEKLVIENTQLSQTLQIKLCEVLDLKGLSVACTASSNRSHGQILNGLKQKLSSEISSRQSVKSKLLKEMLSVETECHQLAALIENLQVQLQDYRVPPVEEYVAAKSSERELDAAIKKYSRKVTIDIQ